MYKLAHLFHGLRLWFARDIWRYNCLKLKSLFVEPMAGCESVLQPQQNFDRWSCVCERASTCNSRSARHTAWMSI